MLKTLLLATLAVVSVAQTSSGIMSADTKRVGSRLACLCKACNNTVGDCLMLDCGYCRPVREHIAALQAQGKDDQTIVDQIVAETGKQARAAPPTEGFSLLAWVMPAVASLLGLGVVLLVVRKLMQRPKLAPANVDPELLNRYKATIDKDLDDLDA